MPILISTDQELISQDEIDFKKLKDESRRKEILKNHQEITEKLIKEHVLDHVTKLDQLQMEYLIAKKKSLELKIKCKEYEAISKTYTIEANQALQKMRKEFLKKIDEEKSKLAQIRGELEQYQQLGSEIDEIAEKYCKSLLEIKQNKWMLQCIKDGCD